MSEQGHYPQRKSFDFHRKTMKDNQLDKSFGIVGALSSVEEHYLHTVGVAGSSPAARTIAPGLTSRDLHGQKMTFRQHAAGAPFGATLLLGLSATCWGQKAIVWVNNYEANTPVYYLKERGPEPSGPVYVELLGGPVGGNLKPVTCDGGIEIKINDWWEFRDVGGGYGGFFDAGLGVVQSVPPGGQADFQLLAWEGSDGFDQATNWGKSEVWTQDVGEWTPGSPPGLTQLLIPNSITVVPHTAPTLLVAKSATAGGVVFSWTVGSESTQLCSVASLGAEATVTVVGSDTGRQAGETVTLAISATKTQEFFFLRR